MIFLPQESLLYLTLAKRPRSILNKVFYAYFSVIDLNFLYFSILMICIFILVFADLHVIRFLICFPVDIAATLNVFAFVSVPGIFGLVSSFL